MDSDKLASMYSEIVNGVPKEQSRFAGADQESGALWDQITKEVEDIKAKHPGAMFEVPSELPSISDGEDVAWQSNPDRAVAQPGAETPPAGAPAPQAPADGEDAPPAPAPAPDEETDQ